MENVIWAKSYIDSLRRMSPTMQGRATLAMMQFVESKNKNSKSLHYEKLHGCREDNIYSIRIADGFRTILCWVPQLEAYLFLYADQHDSAYDWAHKAVISLDSEVMTIQMYEAPGAETAPAPAEQGLFPAGQYSDKSLRRLGVPEDLLPLVRSIQNDDQLLEQMDALPAELGERLFGLATGTPLSDILEEIEANKAAAGGDPMKNPETLRSFFVLPSDPDLREAVLQGGLEQWRIFLHPTQRRLVEERFDGPALVLGGAGTGKTITALHRAKALAARMIQEKTEGKILYTFYTANLIYDISDKLRSICTAEEFKRIDVLNLDKLPRLDTISGYEQTSILYPNDNILKRLWEDAISIGDPQRTRPAGFYQREWERVIAEQEAFTLEEYLAVRRVGGRKPLSSAQRREVWRVFDAYQSLMHERRMFDYKTAMYLYRQYVSNQADPQYCHIIVDEAQDFDTGSLRLLRTLAGPERKDDIFLVGDPRQRIYDRRASLSACGIQVQGRIRQLWMNYRTTYQLQESATRLLDEESFDDLNGGMYQNPRYFSCTSGELPQVKFFGSETEEIQWIYEELEQLKRSGVPARDICLTASSKSLTSSYIKQLNSMGIQTYELKNKADDRSLEGIRVGTMHRIKGLEFQYVFIAGMNRGVFPSKAAIQSEENLKRAKCLLYVALTRAQKGAYVCGYGKTQSEFLAELNALIGAMVERQAAVTR
ncbi:MAG: AAA family ATPase [Clostridiales bacterium]|nr:AAA family ATPase [Clostridiales bacterium]